MSRFHRLNACLTLAAACGLIAFSGAGADETDPELEQVRQKVSDTFKSIEPENVHRSPVDGWFMIQKGAIVAYVSSDGRYLLQGDLFDLDDDVNLTEEARIDARRDAIADVSDSEVITFAPEDPKYSVTVFTDIDCSYCRRLHSQIDQYLANGIEVRYLLYPRGGPSSRSWNTAEEVWCSPDRNNALTMAKLDRGFETRSCDASIVREHYDLGHEIGLSGTPAIVLEDGELLAGYLPPDALRMRLESKAAKPQAASVP